MRIGIDGRELTGHPTGAGRYLGGLLAEWAASPAAAGHEFVLYVPAPVDTSLDPQRFPQRVVSGFPGTVWEQRDLARAAAQDRLGVFFSPAYTAPLALDVPLVVAIHDVSFAARPEWYRLREGVRRRFLCRQSARRAAAVVTISRFSQREIVEHFGIAPSRIHVIPPGVTPPPPEHVTTEGSAAAAPRVLFAGSIFNRRHVPDLIRAVARLARHRTGISLDIVGDNRSFPYERLDQVIAAEGAGDCVRWQRYVSDAELGTLYARARAFAFLSEYEGLGLTPLEALAAGVPPVLLDTPVAHESCGAAAAYVGAGDITGTAAVLERVLFDARERARILMEAPRALAAYDWPTAAARTLALLERR